MRAERPRLSLGELTENFDSRRVPVKEADRRAGSYPYYGASGIVDYVDDYLFEGEYLLIAEDGENLRSRNTPVAFLARGKFWVNNHAHIVRGNSLADTRYLMYAIRALDIGGYLTGSTLPKLTQRNMNQILVPAPPIDEQRAIAHVLGSLDDKIELNGRMNETLEAIARAVFKSWFVDFDPVRARAEGRETGLPKHLSRLFPDSLEDSELGQIPAGWLVAPIGDLASLSRDNVTPGDFPDESFDHYSIPAFDKVKAPIREVGSQIKSNKNGVPWGCVLLSKLNPRFPRVWLPDLSQAVRSVCSTEFLVANSRSTSSPEFLYSLFTSVSFAREFATLVTGTSGSHQRVNADSLTAMKTVLPAPELLESFSGLAGALLNRVHVGTSESRKLAELRDALLPKLISGEIRVKEAEKHMEAAS